MPVRLGESFEAAIWMTGKETEQQRNACVIDMREAFRRMAVENKVMIEPPQFSILEPGSERCPGVPDNISGPCVCLLVAEAMIVGYAPESSPAGSFVQDLELVDRKRLRTITRQAHQKQCPGERRLTDAECDAIAEQVGPESAGRAIREMKDRGRVH